MCGIGLTYSSGSYPEGATAFQVGPRTIATAGHVWMSRADPVYPDSWGFDLCLDSFINDQVALHPILYSAGRDAGDQVFDIQTVCRVAFPAEYAANWNDGVSRHDYAFGFLPCTPKPFAWNFWFGFVQGIDAYTSHPSVFNLRKWGYTKCFDNAGAALPAASCAILGDQDRGMFASLLSCGSPLPNAIKKESFDENGQPQMINSRCPHGHGLSGSPTFVIVEDQVFAIGIHQGPGEFGVNSDRVVVITDERVDSFVVARAMFDQYNPDSNVECGECEGFDAWDLPNP